MAISISNCLHYLLLLNIEIVTAVAAIYSAEAQTSPSLSACTAVVNSSVITSNFSTPSPKTNWLFSTKLSSTYGSIRSTDLKSEANEKNSLSFGTLIGHGMVNCSTDVKNKTALEKEKNSSPGISVSPRMNESISKNILVLKDNKNGTSDADLSNNSIPSMNESTHHNYTGNNYICIIYCKDTNIYMLNRLQYG